MLIPNLAVLLAERRLTLSKVSEDTRISRTTLTSLASRSAKGVQFDTLNTLCQYLKVPPEALFIYLPFDLSLSASGRLGHSEIAFTVTRSGESERFALDCDARPRFAPGDPSRLEGLSLRLALPEGADPAIVDLLHALPASVLADLELELFARFDRSVGAALAPDDYSPSLRWPWE